MRSGRAHLRRTTARRGEGLTVRRAFLAATLALVAFVVPRAGAASTADPFADCQSGDARVAVGVVACRTMPSADLGGTTAFSYFVPPGCAAHRCPTLYLLHGFGGDLTSTHRRPAECLGG